MRTFTCVAMAVVLTVASPAAASVDDYIGKVVGSVRLVIEGRETHEPALRQVVQTPVDAPLSMAQVRETIVHLFSLGRFEDVRVDASLESGRVALRYDLSPIHPVTRFRFEGELDRPGIDAGALRRAIVDRYGSSPALARTADISRIVTEALRQRGYLHPTLTSRADVSHDPEQATLVVSVDPGVRTTIRTVDVVGPPSVPREEFLDRLGLRTGAPYERDALNTRIDRYIAERRSRGYYEATLAASVRLLDGERTADVALTVAPGPHVRVEFAGDPLPEDKRSEFVPVEREGSVDEDLLEDSSNRIEEYLRTLGYRAATAPHTREASGDELVIRFTVTRGQPYRVGTYEISGNASVPLSEFEPVLRLRGGQPFSDARLEADRAAIEQIYRRRGFSQARAQAGVDVITQTPPPAQVPVAVRIVIAEGVRTTVERVTFEGNASVGEAALLPAVALQAGAPFVPAQLALDRDAVLLAYQNRGYENASVELQPVYSDDRTRVDVRYVIHEGSQIFIDHVLIAGNVRTSANTIERELQIRPGSPLSLAAIAESERRLAVLGLFRRARITVLSHGTETTRDVLVTIEEAPPTTVGVGAGVEGKLRVVTESQGAANQASERFELAPRAFFEIGRRNLFGRNRSANLFTSISLHPTDSTTASETSSRGGYRLPEYRIVGTFREPRLFDTAADAFVNVTFEQQIRSSFNFRRSSASAQVARRLTRDISVTGAYQIQRAELIDVKVGVDDPSNPFINRLFSRDPRRLSSLSATVIDDTRNDAVNPSDGQYLSAVGQVTAKAIGSQIGFAKSLLTAQAFRTLPASNGVVFAGSARLGLAHEFDEDQPIPEPERFFAGGDTTVRGFALDTLGRPDTLANGFPIGGNALAIFNAELRVPVRGDFGVVGFIDTGNVFRRAADISLADLRTAAGGGLRYRSPFGPLRIDLGFKLRRQENEGFTAWFVSFGQAF